MSSLSSPAHRDELRNAGLALFNPYFRQRIYTWASLISTVLAALTAGYFLGGWLADRTASVAVLAVTVLVASAYLLGLRPLPKPCSNSCSPISTTSAPAACSPSFAILFFPVTFLGMYSRSPSGCCCARRKAPAWSRTVYGVSTAGSIVGTLGTTFFLIPAIGSRAITLCSASRV